METLNRHLCMNLWLVPQMILTLVMSYNVENILEKIFAFTDGVIILVYVVVVLNDHVGVPVILNVNGILEDNRNSFMESIFIAE